MRAVVYHTWTPQPWGEAKGWNPGPELYRKLFEGLRKNVHEFGIDVVLLTLGGCRSLRSMGEPEALGDDNLAIGGPIPDAWFRQVVEAREVAFSWFLQEHAAPSETYWFTEPDSRILEEIPPLPEGVDLALCYRKDSGPHITPAWRLARQGAQPFFDRCVYMMVTRDVDRCWNGDSEIFSSLWEEMGKPVAGDIVEFLGVRIQLRAYKDYIKPGRYTRNWKWRSKEQLVQ